MDDYDDDFEVDDDSKSKAPPPAREAIKPKKKKKRKKRNSIVGDDAHEGETAGDVPTTPQSPGSQEPSSPIPVNRGPRLFDVGVHGSVETVRSEPERRGSGALGREGARASVGDAVSPVRRSGEGLSQSIGTAAIRQSIDAAPESIEVPRRSVDGSISYEAPWKATGARASVSVAGGPVDGVVKLRQSEAESALTEKELRLDRMSNELAAVDIAQRAKASNLQRKEEELNEMMERLLERQSEVERREREAKSESNQIASLQHDIQIANVTISDLQSAVAKHESQELEKERLRAWEESVASHSKDIQDAKLTNQREGLNIEENRARGLLHTSEQEELWAIALSTTIATRIAFARHEAEMARELEVREQRCSARETLVDQQSTIISIHQKEVDRATDSLKGRELELKKREAEVQETHVKLQDCLARATETESTLLRDKVEIQFAKHLTDLEYVVAQWGVSHNDMYGQSLSDWHCEIVDRELRVAERERQAVILEERMSTIDALYCEAQQRVVAAQKSQLDLEAAQVLAHNVQRNLSSILYRERELERSRLGRQSDSSLVHGKVNEHNVLRRAMVTEQTLIKLSTEFLNCIHSLRKAIYSAYDGQIDSMHDCVCTSVGGLEGSSPQSNHSQSTAHERRPSDCSIEHSKSLSLITGSMMETHQFLLRMLAALKDKDFGVLPLNLERTPILEYFHTESSIKANDVRSSVSCKFFHDDIRPIPMCELGALPRAPHALNPVNNSRRGFKFQCPPSLMKKARDISEKYSQDACQLSDDDPPSDDSVRSSDEQPGNKSKRNISARVRQAALIYGSNAPRRSKRSKRQ